MLSNWHTYFMCSRHIWNCSNPLSTRIFTFSLSSLLQVARNLEYRWQESFSINAFVVIVIILNYIARVINFILLPIIMALLSQTQCKLAGLVQLFYWTITCYISKSCRLCTDSRIKNKSNCQWWLFTLFIHFNSNCIYIQLFMACIPGRFILWRHYHHWSALRSTMN